MFDLHSATYITEMENQILFIEKQYFRQFLVIGLLAFVNLFFAVGFIQQIVLGHPWG